MLMYGKNHYNIVISLQLKFKNKKFIKIHNLKSEKKKNLETFVFLSLPVVFFLSLVVDLTQV